MGFFDALRQAANAAPGVMEAGAQATTPSATTPPIVADPNMRMPRIRPDAPTGTAPAPTGGGGVNQDTGGMEAFIQSWQQSHPPTAESMQQMVAALNQQGYPVMIASRAGGSAASGDKLVFPDGMVVDIIGDEGGPGAKWTYNPNPNDRFGGGHQVYDAQGNRVNYGEFLQSKGLPIPTATPGAGGVGTPPGGGGRGYTIGQVGGQYPLAAFSGQGLLDPFAAPFQSPGGFQIPGEAGMLEDPGYQFRQKEGQQAIERSAAAKGTLLTGGTLKDLQDYAQGVASQEYQNVYGRRLGEHDRAYQRAWDEYMGAFGIYDKNRNFQYDALSGVANTGLNAANTGAQTGSSYAARGGNTLTDKGNVAGAQEGAYAQGAARGATTIGGMWPDSWKFGGKGGGGSAPTDYTWQGPIRTANPSVAGG